MEFSAIVSMAEVLAEVLAEDLVEDHPFFVFSSSLPASSPCDVRAFWSRKPIDEIWNVCFKVEGKLLIFSTANLDPADLSISLSYIKTWHALN